MAVAQEEEQWEPMNECELWMVNEAYCSAVTVSYRSICTVLVSLGHVNEYLLALKAMRAEGLIPALSGVCWFLLPVGWCSVASAACEHQ